MLTTAASDFKKINNEVLGNHNKMNMFFFLRRFLKNPIVITNKKVNQAVEKNGEKIKMLESFRRMRNVLIVYKRAIGQVIPPSGGGAWGWPPPCRS